ncbi:site-specific integrase [Pusillimonas caeni]|uniref:tyrosine-type recombinase/integrase n=1 Tax=Pusillimonas caeni TaxID=1348472 RepID=UPI000E59FB0A|nr:site-specific integrase [Pusillimonas caeni]TFL14170.1 site-specific integrase [Pusillimonas caeni]
MPIRKDKETGVWHIDFRSPSGQRVRCSARTTDRKAAQEYHDRLKAEHWRQSMLGEEPDHSFEEGALIFLQASEGQRDYETKVRHIKWWRAQFEGRPLRSLTSDEIVKALPTHRRHKYGKPTPIKPATRNRYLATIRKMLNVCVEAEWLEKAPKLPQYVEPRVRIRWEPPHIIAKIIGNISLDWLRDAAIVAVATGMRESELFGMPPSGVNVEHRSTWVSHDDAKSARARAVPLNNDAFSVVERRMKTAKDYVFTRDGGDGRRIRKHDRRAFQHACTLAGVKNFKWHDLRHTWASWHVQAGTPLMVVKELGGWEKIEMVQKYAHLAPSHLAAHANTVNFWSSQIQKDETPLVRVA